MTGFWMGHEEHSGESTHKTFNELKQRYFLCDMYGLSGPASKFPYLWCTCSKQEILKPRRDRPEEVVRNIKKKNHMSM